MLNKSILKQFTVANLLIAALILSGAALDAGAAWGDLDTSFGVNGTYQETALGYELGSVAVQPDGKILVTGSMLASNGKKRFFLRRYLSNGTSDTSFGSGGSAIIKSIIIPNNNYGGIEVRMLTASKIIVLGHSGEDIAVWMVNGDGTGNTSFGTNGFKVLSGYKFNSSKLGSLGSRVVVGYYDPSNLRVAVIKLNSDGTIDTTFGGDGKAHVNIFGSAEQIPYFEMITEADTNKVTVAGLSLVSEYPPIRIERMLSNGAYDYSFAASGNGASNAAFLPLNGLKKLNGGKYFYNHIELINGLPHAFLSRTNSTGTLEERVSTGLSGKLLGVQPDGLIVTEAGYFINRFDQNLDGQGGFSVYPNLNEFEYRRHAFQPDNKMVVAGIMDNKLTLVRLLAE